MSKLIVNVETNEVIERELNQNEIKQQELDAAKLQAKIDADNAKAAARQALLNKLGITEEEARLLLGGN